ncbi:MAG: carboxypeptidase-like regulatory domain-containing protein, partial [Lachnospiraceae bacterium]|nr:carboxypeptidase-like regulatory domain-containing protein [Lachnospiraceae bacterium]
MRKERDRIVAWLLTFVMVFLMAVGDEQIVWAGDEYVNVTVTVTDSNENPITGATVKPYLNGAEYTRKDAVDNEDGTYTLELLSGTAFRIKVSADGYVSGEITAATYSSESNTASITLETCSISGKVLDGSSNGISGATVTATPGSDGSTLTTTTGSDGSYTINSGVIYNETYTITVSSTGYDTSSISESVTIGQASNTVSNITLSDTVELVITLTSSTVTSGETMTPTVKAGTEDVSRDVTWSVDSTSTGSVIINGTTFTAGDAGTVILTATYGAATATVTVTINAKSQTITVQDGTETVSTITKTYGDTATYTVDGVGTLTAESSDKDVVEVSSTATDGFTVKFTGVGTATLTVTRAGDSQNASASKEISVTVNRRTVTVTVTAATGDDGTLETEVQSVSNAADSDTDLANYIEIMTSQYTDEDKSIVGYTLGWSNSASSAYKTNYTFTDSGTISTASASYTKSEVEAGVTISKVYDGTKTITSNMVTITAEDNGGTDISSYITLDFDSSTFGNVNVGESKTVNYILTWTDNAPASVTNLYSLPSGTQSGSVGTVTAREVKIQSITLMNRKYDGTDVVEITTGTACVKLKEEQTSLDADDLNDQVAALYLTGTVNVDSADAGTRTATGFDEVELATDEEDVEASNFTLISSDTASYFTSNTVTVTISRAIIYLQFSDLIYTYDDVPNGINQVNCSCLSETADNTTVNVTIYEYVFGCTETDDLMTGAQEALKEYSKTWSLALTASELDTDEESLEPGLDVGSYENKIGLTGLVSTDDTVDVGTNYQLQVKEAAQFGDITVTQDDTTYDIDDVTAAGSFYIKDNTLYVKSGATFTVSQNVDDTLYDQVWIGTESDDSVTFTTNLTAGVTIDDLVAAGSGKDVTLYLAKYGKNVSQGFTITLHNDGTAPSAAFAVGEETLDSQDFASSVTFGVIDNKTVTVDLTVEDAESGIASIETYLYTGSKAEIDALDGQKDTLDDLSGIWEWAEATIEEDYGSSEAYTVSAAYTVESNTYAVAFARVTDTVGNICIYGSNGLVVEVNTPNVPTITYSTAKNYGDGVYNGDVSVTIQVSEKLASEEDIASGLQSVTYTIYKDGKAVSGYTDVELFEDTLEEAIAGGTVTLEQLQSAVSMKLEKTVTIPASVFNSNNVYVAVRVTDQARNTSEATGVVIQIDVTEPTIEVSYDNNSAANTHYFKKARTATIVYTERNFDIDKVTFDLTLADGAKRTLSFRELGAIAGIRISYAASEDDSQYGRSTSNYTDVRTNTLTITFSGDNDYTVVPYFEDLAGNEPEEIAYASSTAEETKTHFIIDTTAPTISITYYDADGNVVTPGKSEKTRLYEDGTVRAVVT